MIQVMMFILLQGRWNDARESAPRYVGDDAFWGIVFLGVIGIIIFQVWLWSERMKEQKNPELAKKRREEWSAMTKKWEAKREKEREIVEMERREGYVRWGQMIKFPMDDFRLNSAGDSYFLHHDGRMYCVDRKDQGDAFEAIAKWKAQSQKGKKEDDNNRSQDDDDLPF